VADPSDPALVEPGPPEPRAPALDQVARRRQINIVGVRISGRRRRPSGAPPPLPRELKRSGKAFLVAGIAIVGIWMSIFAFPATTEWWGRRDLAVLNVFVDLRNDGATQVMHVLHALGSEWFIRPLRWGILVVLVVFRRWRALAGAVATLIIVAEISRGLVDWVARPRPMVEMIGDWQGYSHPSLPVAGLSVTLVLVGVALIPAGVWRRRWMLLAGALVLTHGVARVYLGVDHPSDVWTAALFGSAVAVLVFRLFVPEAVFPVTYQRGRAAHLAITPDRARAVGQALRDQLGLEVLAIEPFGLAGSGGSTPLRIRCAGDPDRYVFGKLYARSHLRADRWYKAGRTILYGTLEDEVRFESVRRLVAYEDYVLLLLSRAGLPSPEPYGFVEITPEREYLLVTEFIEGAREMSDAEVTTAVIDEALLVVRRMWDEGLAHRDIKPANVLVRGDEVVLIDPAFATVRPSPWRQAVDLANMMLVLALRSSAELVYERAMRYFSREDVAEAFASTRGVTIPTQSKSSLDRMRRSTGVDLIERFRELAPPREPISIQRWSPRRVGLTLAAVSTAAVSIWLLLDNVRGTGFV
jgi:tRNA A-37 threonylcarbamoyl transferase component Bud32/membrane-associated phospholipid phosphatase